jgi:hypothetical protein
VVLLLLLFPVVLLFSVLQSFFLDKRTLEEVFLRLFWRSSFSILAQIIEAHHLAPATLIRRKASGSLKFSNNFLTIQRCFDKNKMSG